MLCCTCTCITYLLETFLLYMVCKDFQLLSKRSMKTTHLLFSLFKDVIDVFLCDLAVLGSKHVTGTVSNHVQHLVFTQFVCTRIHQATCKDTPTLIKLQSMSPPLMGLKIYFSQNKASSMCTLLYDHVI